MTFRNGMMVSAIVLGLGAGAASADPGAHHGQAAPQQMNSGHDMMDMMTRMHGMMGGGMMSGMGYGGMMPGMGGMQGMSGMGFMSDFDTDGDGIVAGDEMRTGLMEDLAEYDADGDGALSIEEFEALHSARIREAMVDRFQHLDADGDGRVTGEEMTAPAERFERMQEMRQRMIEATGQGMPDQPGMMGDANDRMHRGKGN